VNRRKLQLDIESLGPHATALQQAKIQERTTALRKRITAWFEIQTLYIPGTTLLRAEEQYTQNRRSLEVEIYDVKLWLPSAIARRTACDRSLQEIEWVFRGVQANDALHTIRQHLRLNSFLTKRKKDWSRGVRANTRSLTMIEQNRWKMRAAIEKYRTAYKALDTVGTVTAKADGWKNWLKILNDEDIRGLPVDGLGEGYRALSWIWMAPGVLNTTRNPDNDPRLHDGSVIYSESVEEQRTHTPSCPALHIQWCRARARKMRWTEEVDLLLEEMRRVGQFLKWHGGWWMERANQRKSVDKGIQEGLSAYAHLQASICHHLKEKFEESWRPVRSWMASGEVVGEDRRDCREPLDQEAEAVDI